MNSHRQESSQATPRSPVRALVERSLARHGRLPLQGNFELTLQCNLRCDHCYLGSDRRREELSTAEVCRILDEMAEAGVLMLTLTGGEVLLRRDFETIYRHAHGRGFLLSVFTNGLLVEDSHVALWQSAPPRRIEVSLYGLDDVTYSTFTRRPVRFAALDDRLRKMVAAKLPLQLKSVATQQLGAQVDAMRAYASELGVGFYFATVVHSAHDGTSLADAERPAPSAACGHEFTEETREVMVDMDARARTQRDERVFSCGAGRVSFHVDPEGTLTRCGMLTGPDAKPVSLREHGFAEAWKRLGSGLDDLLPEGHPCRSCQVRHLCSRCPATDSEEAEIAMCELAYERAKQLGHALANEAPMRAYWMQRRASESILQRRFRG